MAGIIPIAAAIACLALLPQLTCFHLHVTPRHGRLLCSQLRVSNSSSPRSRKLSI
ncbi:hypothetical protein BDM02DRAFT_3117009 [Thelephora ganbajun]|uniref:Uncharacterized protein n=1 Tax=Thelephora ganbajun TaxID=370292 RepID=A0ACB6ZD19_THEGA|nr:hypothetical protein BDM02DRAFT_3117009 [Thelephora ganbajun]